MFVSSVSFIPATFTFHWKVFLVSGVVFSLNLFIKGDEPSRGAGDELPPALEVAIRNPAIPMIVDASITSYTKEGYAKIKVNKVYKKQDGKNVSLPATVRGYRMDGAKGRVVPIRVFVDKGKTRFLFFLKGDLLYSTYNNRFEIREEKGGKLVVHNGRTWQPLADILTHSKR